jgi:hypothetical protein
MLQAGIRLGRGDEVGYLLVPRGIRGAGRRYHDQRKTTNEMRPLMRSGERGAEQQLVAEGVLFLTRGHLREAIEGVIPVKQERDTWELGASEAIGKAGRWFVQ